MIQEKFVYLIALIPFCVIWSICYIKRKDLRREIMIMSLLIGFLSVATSYYWWTIDWWRPLNITSTKVGIEDLIMGFTTGGIMASLYEIVFKKGFSKRNSQYYKHDGLLILFILAQLTTWLFYVTKLTSFVSATVAMCLTSFFMLSIRKDLIIDSFLSGIFMLLVSSFFYLIIIFISPDWIDKTYLNGLSGIRTFGIPVEEWIFWFLAGILWGPFYEFWKGKSLKNNK